MFDRHWQTERPLWVDRRAEVFRKFPTWCTGPVLGTANLLDLHGGTANFRSLRSWHVAAEVLTIGLVERDRSLSTYNKVIGYAVHGYVYRRGIPRFFKQKKSVDETRSLPCVKYIRAPLFCLTR